MNTAPSGGAVLVTGGSGYLGAHVVVRLLQDGHHVRATVRDPGRAAEVLEAVRNGGADPGGRLEVVAADLASDDGWAEAVAGRDHVVHVASPFPLEAPRHEDELIVPARDGALRVLRAARDAGVKRVVMTSSFAAVGYSPKPGADYTEEDWTDPAADIPAYHRSKTLAERAAWDFARTEGGGLELTVINPTGIFGPTLSPRLSTSTKLVRAMLDGHMRAVPRLYFGVVDVRDAADAHVLAMTGSAAAGQRFLAVGDGPAVTFPQIARIIARRFPSLAARMAVTEIPDDQVREGALIDPALEEAAGRLGHVPVIHNDKARDLLGWRPRDLETTLVDTVESLKRHGLLEG
ncbi:SDR family oxidoreductase [Sphaerisporangium sp. NPDC004334]